MRIADCFVSVGYQPARYGNVVNEGTALRCRCTVCEVEPAYEKSP
jgi:hypothetical protein